MNYPDPSTQQEAADLANALAASAAKIGDVAVLKKTIPGGVMMVGSDGVKYLAIPLIDSVSGVSQYVPKLSSRKAVRLDALKYRVASMTSYKTENAVYYDNAATGSTGAGTKANPFTTWAQVQNWAQVTRAGNCSDWTLFVKCGTVTRGASSLTGVYGTKDSGPFQIMPYGDGPLPIFAGGDVIPAASWVPRGGGIYTYAIASNCDAFENGDRLLKLALTTGSEAATLTAAGPGNSGYNASTGVLWIYPTSITSTLEINNAQYALQINVADNINAGNVHIYGMHGRLAKNTGISINGHQNAGSNNTFSGAIIAYCSGGNIGFDQAGGGGVGDGILLYGPIANADSVKANYCAVRGCYSYDCLNNAIELSATSKAVVELNEADGVGSNMCELWACNDSAHVRYNLHRGDNLRASRLNNGWPGATMVWVNGLLKAGTLDAAGTYNSNNKIYFNISINPGLRGVRVEGGGSGTVVDHNTFIYTDGSMAAGGTQGAVLYSVCNTGTTQAVECSRNLVAGFGATNLLGVAIACDGSAAITPTGDYNIYSGVTVGWRKAGTTYWTLATWQTAIGAGMDAHSLAGANSGGTVTHDLLGLDVLTSKPSPVGVAAAFGTDALGYVRDYSGVPVPSGTNAGFAGAVCPA